MREKINITFNKPIQEKKKTIGKKKKKKKPKKKKKSKTKKRKKYKNKIKIKMQKKKQRGEKKNGKNITILGRPIQAKQRKLKAQIDRSSKAEEEAGASMGDIPLRTNTRGGHCTQQNTFHAGCHHYWVREPPRCRVSEPWTDRWSSSQMSRGLLLYLFLY